MNPLPQHLTPRTLTLPPPSRRLPAFGTILLLLLVYLSGIAHAQNLTYSIVPGGSIDITGPTGGGGHWYFKTDPSPSSATMYRVSSDGISEYAWGGTTANGNFYNDVPNNSQNRLYQGEFLRVKGGTTPVGSTITIAYDTSPIQAGATPSYTISIAVQNAAQVTSLNITDPNPASASTLHWQVVFDRAITGVSAANFVFNNSAAITPAPTVSGVAPTTAGDNTKWTITVNAPGTTTGILGLNWKGHSAESPSVPNQFVGQSYQFSQYPNFSQYPVASENVAVNATPPALTVAATVRTGETIHYNWYLGTSTNPNAATLVASNGGTSYQPPTQSTAGTVQYFCRAYTNSPSGYYTDSTTANVNFLVPVGVIAQPASVNIFPNKYTSFQISVSGSAPAIQWYQGSVGMTTNPISGATYNTFQTPPLSANTQYWAQVTNAISSANSTAAKVTVLSSLTLVNPTLTATVGTAFANPMAVTVKDSTGTVVSGVNVNFNVPNSAATFPSSALSANATTNGSGLAVSPTLTARTVANTYTGHVLIYATDTSSTDLPVSLGIVAGPPAAIMVIGGSSRLAAPGSAFASPLYVNLVDAYGNPVTGATVTFTVPSSGASAVLSSQSAVTDSFGSTSVTARANATAGAYKVTANVSPALASAATFSLANFDSLQN